MGLWQQTRQRLGLAPRQSTKLTKSDWTKPTFWTNGFGGRTLGRYGEVINSEEIFAAISRLANTVSSLPIMEYKDTKAVDTTASLLLTSEANPSMSSFSLINQTETSRNIDGNAYILIERDANLKPVALYPIKPESVIVKRNVDDNSIWYTIASDEFNMTVFNTEMIHVKHISPAREVLGISPLDVLRGTVDYDRAVEDFSLNQMQKKDQFIIKYDRSVSDERRKAMIEDFHRMITENGGAVVQEKGFEYQKFATEFQPSDLSTSMNITRNRVANVFNIPTIFLNGQDSTGNGKTNEQIMANFVQMTLVPILRQYESEFNRKLLSDQERRRGYRFKFDVNGLLRGDTTARTNFYQMLVRNGIATVNDLRRLEDLPISDEPNADKLWITGDLYPLSLDVSERNRAGTTTGSQSPEEGSTSTGDDASKKGGE